MSYMATATVREVQHQLRAFLDRVERGEEIAITRRGHAIARLAPLRPKRTKRHWPDFEARMKRLFPDGVPKGEPPSESIRTMRGERL